MNFIETAALLENKNYLCNWSGNEPRTTPRPRDGARRPKAPLGSRRPAPTGSSRPANTPTPNSRQPPATSLAPKASLGRATAALIPPVHPTPGRRTRPAPNTALPSTRPPLQRPGILRPGLPARQRARRLLGRAPPLRPPALRLPVDRAVRPRRGTPLLPRRRTRPLAASAWTPRSRRIRPPRPGAGGVSRCSSAPPSCLPAGLPGWRSGTTPGPPTTPPTWRPAAHRPLHRAAPGRATPGPATPGQATPVATPGRNTGSGNSGSGNSWFRAVAVLQRRVSRQPVRWLGRLDRSVLGWIVRGATARATAPRAAPARATAPRAPARRRPRRPPSQPRSLRPWSISTPPSATRAPRARAPG